MLGHLARRPARRVHRAARERTRSSSPRRRTRSSRAVPTVRTRCSRRSCAAARERADGRAPRLPIDDVATSRRTLTSTLVPPVRVMTGFRVVDTTTRARQPASSSSSSATGRGRRRRGVRPHVVRHPGAVVVVPVDRRRAHVLLVRQYRVAVGRELLEVAGGQARRRRASRPRRPRRRELEEEIGHRAGRLRAARASSTTRPGFCDEYTYLYCALDLEPSTARHAATRRGAAMTVERVAARRRRRPDRAPARSSTPRRIIGLLLARRTSARPAAARLAMAGVAPTRSTTCSRSTRRGCAVERGLAPELARGVPARPAPLRRLPARARDPRPRRRRRGRASRAYVERAARPLATTTAGRAVRRVVDRPGARRGALVPPLLRRRGARRRRPDRGRRARRGCPQGIPKALTEAEVEALLGAVHRRRPARAARPGDPRDALRRRAAHQRARRARPRATSTSTTGLVRVLGKGAQGAGRPDRAPGPGRARRLPRARPPRARAARRRARRRGDAVFLNARGGRLTRQGCWGIVRDAGDRAGLGRPAVARTCCATRAPRTCSTTAPTSGSCRSCSATPACRPRRCTRRCRPSGCGPSTTPAHPRARARSRRPAGTRLARRRSGGVRRGTIGPWPTADRMRSLRAQLEEERERLRAQLARARRRGDARASTRASPTPSQVTAERGEVEALAGTLTETLARDRGRPGQARRRAPTARASRAASEIAEARLEAMPAARLCIACASQPR